jgi:hypothetical protein
MNTLFFLALLLVCPLMMMWMLIRKLGGHVIHEDREALEILPLACVAVDRLGNRNDAPMTSAPWER